MYQICHIPLAILETARAMWQLSSHRTKAQQIESWQFAGETECGERGSGIMTQPEDLLLENDWVGNNEETGAEAAGRIYRDHSLSVREKQLAWQALVKSGPDETVCVRNFVTEKLERISLHELLLSYMAEQKKVELQFFADEPDVVYLCALQNLSTDEFVEIREPSLSWEGCVQKIADYQDWEMIPGRYRAVATKFWPKRFVDGFMKEISAEFDEIGTLMDVHSQMMMTLPNYRNVAFKMEQLINDPV